MVPVGSNSELEITPNQDGYIELDSQQASNNTPVTLQNNNGGVDVLGALGLSSGVVRTVNTVNGLTDVKQLREYGLDLPTNLDLSTTTNAQHASNALQAAMYAVQKAYQDLVTPPTMASEQAAAQKSSGGTVPTYLTNEIANYSAGLPLMPSPEQAEDAAAGAAA